MKTNKYTKWTISELRSLRSLIESGKTLKECSEKLNRSPHGITAARYTYSLPKFKNKLYLKNAILKDIEEYPTVYTQPEIKFPNPETEETIIINEFPSVLCDPEFESILCDPKPITESTSSLVELLIQSAKEKNIKVTITFESLPL